MAPQHDNLFRLVFGEPSRAAAWLRTVLPAIVVASIEWGSLQPAPDKLIRETLRLDEADVVFAARFIDGRPLWILIEHKSYRDPGVTDQVGRYVLALRERAPFSGGKLPAPVLAVVAYHGESPLPQFLPLPAGMTSDDATVDDIVAALAPRQPLFVDDLTRRSERELRHADLDPLVRLPLLCFAFLGRYPVEEAALALRRWGALLRSVDRHRDREVAGRVMRAIKWYCLSATDIPVEQLEQIFEQLLERPDEDIMSTAERLLRQGEARGEARGRAAVLRRQIDKRFGPQPAEMGARIEARLAAAGTEELDRLAERILDVGSIAELFDER